MSTQTSLNWAKIKSYYDDCATLIDDNARAMGWSSKFNQQLRFDVLNYLVSLDGASVLDVGCGDGALFHYLKQQGISVDYNGIDISSKMVQRAQHRYPGISVRQADFFDVKGTYDVLFCSGALSMCPSDAPMSFLADAIHHLFSLTRKHLVFNLLSVHVPSKSSKFQRFSPPRCLNPLF